jgi:hypothetical protein
MVKSYSSQYSGFSTTAIDKDNGNNPNYYSKDLKIYY